MDYKKSQKVLFILQNVALLLILAYFLVADKNRDLAIVFGMAAMVVILLDVAQVFKFLRCPNCGTNLYPHGHGKLPDRCPKCGFELFHPSAEEPNEREDRQQEQN